MTVMEFLDALAASPRTWRVRKDGRIQNRDRDCPYLWLRHARHGVSSLTGPGAVDWMLVWDAADNDSGHNPVIRRALLDACGLLT